MHRSLLNAKVNLERIRTRTFGGSVSFEASRFISDRATSKYDKPVRTDEGVIVHQSDPSAHSSGQGLVWGSVLWPSGTCLAKYMSYRSETSCDLPDMTLLDLGCGTGVVGLTCAKLGARHVTLSDSATDLYPILRKSVAENHLSDRIDIHSLDWRDVTTFLDPSRRPYDMILAADVLYAGMDGLFARALASHLPSKKNNLGRYPHHLGVPLKPSLLVQIGRIRLSSTFSASANALVYHWTASKTPPARRQGLRRG